jgi:hypothetical protein
VGSGTALVGADGTVVAVQPGPSDLVAVEGPNDLAVGDHLDEPGLLAVAAAMPDGVRQAIIGIQSTSDGVTLRLSADNAVVQLGAADQLAAKLAAVETMLAQVDTTCMMLTLDLDGGDRLTCTAHRGRAFARSSLNLNLSLIPAGPLRGVRRSRIFRQERQLR